MEGRAGNRPTQDDCGFRASGSGGLQHLVHLVFGVSAVCLYSRCHKHLGNLHRPGSHLAAKKFNWCPVASTSMIEQGAAPDAEGPFLRGIVELMSRRRLRRRVQSCRPASAVRRTTCSVDCVYAVQTVQLPLGCQLRRLSLQTLRLAGRYHTTAVGLARVGVGPTRATGRSALSRFDDRPGATGLGGVRPSVGGQESRAGISYSRPIFTRFRHFYIATQFATATPLP